MLLVLQIVNIQQNVKVTIYDPGPPGTKQIKLYAQNEMKSQNRCIVYNATP